MNSCICLSASTRANLLLLTFLGAALIVDAQSAHAQLTRIEANGNHTDNIRQLESILIQKNLADSLQFKARMLLIDNYNKSSQHNKAIELSHLGIIESQTAKQTYREASLNLALARTYYYLKQMDQFALYNQTCLGISEQNGHFDLLKRAYHNVGVIEFELHGDFKKAEAAFLKAIQYNKLVRQNKNDNAAKNLRMLATTYDAQGKFKKADSVYRVTSDVYTTFHDTLGLSEVLIFRARLYLSMSQFDTAIRLSDEALRLSETTNDPLYIQTALSMKEQLCVVVGNYAEAYKIKSRIFEMTQANDTKMLKEAIAESEARFKVAELKNKEQLSALAIEQEKRTFIFMSITATIFIAAALVLIYQRKISNQKQLIRIESVRQIYEAEEKERLRIAKDLHDNMGAHTTSIISQIDMMTDSREVSNSVKLKNLRDDAESIMSILRETIWLLKNKNVSIEEFYDLVKIYANRNLTEYLNIGVSFTSAIKKPERNLNSTISINIYRIIQEAIQNIIKHSAATRVEFNVSVDDKISITIVDNGKGFDFENHPRRSGLANMQQRADEVGFQLAIESNPGAGCRIEITEE